MILFCMHNYIDIVIIIHVWSKMFCIIICKCNGIANYTLIILKTLIATHIQHSTLFNYCIVLIIHTVSHVFL